LLVLEDAVRGLVVYESLWGNTEKIARTIADRLSVHNDVDVVDSDNAPVSVDDYDFVVVGGPTHAFSMTRTSTRADAVASHSAPHHPKRGIREWIGALDKPGKQLPAAAFDTRVDKPRLPGSAAKSAQRDLRALGFELSARHESFRVHGYEGPLVDGETERACGWADAMEAQFLSAV
jgi:flavorubredoxin